MEKLNNIIQILSLLTTDKRKQSYKELILFILFALHTSCSDKEINDFIDNEFGIKLQADEFKEAINELLEDGTISVESDKKYVLSKNVYEDFEANHLKSKAKNKELETEFYAQIDEISGNKINIEGKTKTL